MGSGAGFVVCFDFCVTSGHLTRCPLAPQTSRSKCPSFAQADRYRDLFKTETPRDVPWEPQDFSAAHLSPQLGGGGGAGAAETGAHAKMFRHAFLKS